MKYLKVFETQAEESAWKESEEYIKTSLSMDKENMDEISYNSKVKFRAEYDLSGLEGDVKLTNCGNIFDSLKVNGAEAVTGKVEASSVEYKYGTHGTRVYFEKRIDNYDNVDDNTLADCAFPIPQGYSFESDLEIEFIDEVTETQLNEGSVLVYMYGQPNSVSVDWYWKDDAHKIIGINLKGWYYYLMYMERGAIEYIIPYFPNGGGLHPVIVRGSYLQGEMVNGTLDVNENDFSKNEQNGIGLSNFDKLLTGKMREVTISHTTNSTNLSILMTMIPSVPNGEMEAEVMSIADMIDGGMIEQVDEKTYTFVNGSEVMMYIAMYKMNFVFIDSDTNNVIETHISYRGETYDSYGITTEGLAFTSVTDMQTAQIKLIGKIDVEMSGMGLMDYSDPSTFGMSENENDGVLGFLAYTDNNGTYDGDLTPLIPIGDELYQFSQSWIDCAAPIFENGGKVLFSWSNTNYNYISPYYLVQFEYSIGLVNMCYKTSYSIIQESISGGAPKELSVDASVGKVSLIGEVNDYFSTLPSSGFERCPLETVIIPDNVKSIGTKCFGHCDRLKKVYLPQNMDKLADYSFGGNSVKRGNVVNVRSVKDESPLAFGDYGG